MRTLVLVTGLLLAPLSLAAEVLATRVVEGCELSLEQEAGSPSVSLRRRPGDCVASEAAVLGVLEQGLVGRPGAVYRSVFLGRLVLYPWGPPALAAAAAASPEWDAQHGQARAGGDNALVARLLDGSGAFAGAARVLAARGHAPAGLAVEKVLVAVDPIPRADPARARRLPFDAQVWLLLEPIGSGSAHGPTGPGAAGG